MDTTSHNKTRKAGSLFLPEHSTTSPLTTIHINKQALEHNIQQYKSIVGAKVLLAPVIKSNAYGHGIYHVAEICENNVNVHTLCVAALSEALMLRKHGITKPLLVLNIIDEALEYAVSNNIELALYDLQMAQELNDIAGKQKKSANIHIKIDTGLSRLGILWDTVAPYAKKLAALPHITLRGIFTHFSESEQQDQTFTNIQIERLNAAINTFKSLDISIPIQHASCSAAITANTSSHYNFTRVGIGLYGLWPSTENKNLTQKKYPQFSLKPALSLQTTVIQIKTIPAGSCIGYDRTFQAPHTMRIATLAAGYWDGIDRRLSNKGHVLINNTLAPIVGRIAMNIMMVDITHIPKVLVGDKALLLSNHKGITADDIALHTGTINYEVVTKINPLLQRFVM